MKKIMYIVFMLFFSQITQLLAQSDIQVFGFFQAGLQRLDGKFSVIADVPPAIFGTDKLVLDEKKDDYLNPSVQQLNLFFRKELSSSFTAWVNLEFIGNFNSINKWGNLSLEEAWVNYQLSDIFNIKGGLLIPRFAYLNEIKNRMPLLPYITRPLIYESSLQAINSSDYIPERAFVQIFGILPIESTTLDYSVFAGPSESAYTAGYGIATGGPSADTTNFKLFGGRVGVKMGDLRLGVSATLDKDNQQIELQQDVSRTRLAFDLGYSLYNFFLDGEYISVNLDPKNTTMDQHKVFYYGTLGHNFSDNIFAYGSYSYLKDEANQVLKAGMNGIIFGAGYKPIESVVLKASYSTYSADSSFPMIIDPQLPAVNTNVILDYKSFQIAVSVLF